LDPEYEFEELFSSIQGRIQSELMSQSQNNATNVKRDGDKQQSAKSGQVNLPNTRRGTGNAVRPQNQQGRRESPNIRRSDSAWLSLVEDLLKDEDSVVYVKEDIDKDNDVKN
jgi:hypothetical protein